ncbi:hypothetical protein AYO21_11510 [Fonsecaea monophora]|uniref:Uncharacterized protein n=1 Tax=Fonsecaea monophora TaxID=254056 RepID=A0A177ESP5_9EURO|nr:hypothetical protein AYO21_11510 [Fonsecaea monophora]OAG34330.1 hypothetical protein AYO21_11510 [Fonsecaea monophora]
MALSCASSASNHRCGRKTSASSPNTLRSRWTTCALTEAGFDKPRGHTGGPPTLIEAGKRRLPYIIGSLLVLAGLAFGAAMNSINFMWAYMILSGFGSAPSYSLNESSLLDISFLHRRGRLALGAEIPVDLPGNLGTAHHLRPRPGHALTPLSPSADPALPALPGFFTKTIHGWTTNGYFEDVRITRRQTGCEEVQVTHLQFDGIREMAHDRQAVRQPLAASPIHTVLISHLRSINKTIKEDWEPYGGPNIYMGLSCPRFPNFYTIVGVGGASLCTSNSTLRFNNQKTRAMTAETEKEVVPAAEAPGRTIDLAIDVDSHDDLVQSRCRPLQRPARSQRWYSIPEPASWKRVLAHVADPTILLSLSNCSPSTLMPTHSSILMAPTLPLW